MESKTPVADVKKKKTKKRIGLKQSPFLSKNFDELSSFDMFDFMQFKTQMKILKHRAQERSENVHDLTELISQISTRKRKNRKLVNKSYSSKKTKLAVKRKVFNHTKLESFMASNSSIVSMKKAKALLKTHEYISDYLKRNPITPVEKSHKRIIPLKNIQKQLTSSLSAEQLKKLTSNLVSSETSSTANLVGLSISASGLNQNNSRNEQKVLSENKGQQIDHVAAINSWIQKNYHTLSTAQKQLVHMQLQYLNTLKKTLFQKQAFVLSPQHLNNLNNLSFLSANYSPFSRNYPNFVNVPNYSMEQQKIQMLKAIQSQQQRSFPLQMPLNFAINPNNTAEKSDEENRPNK